MLSYWEKDWMRGLWDAVVLGGGFVGLSAGIHLKKSNSSLRVLMVERGTVSKGASSKNAGFACFGSAGELLADIANVGMEATMNTVAMRWDGLKLLRELVGSDQNMDYHGLGGFEVFEGKKELERIREEIPMLNKALDEAIGLKDVFSDVSSALNAHGLGKMAGMVRNQYEGQLDPQKAVRALERVATGLGVEMVQGVEVEKMEQGEKGDWELATTEATIKARKLLVCTNGFATELLPQLAVEPARAQVLITEPIKGLKLQGAYHLDEGYYYFRNVGDRILLGGGRNLDFSGERTTKTIVTAQIQARLEKLLYEQIGKDYGRDAIKIEQRWAGIMGIGKEKRPIIEALGNGMYVGVRMGGMGVAIGTLVGRELAEVVVE